MLIIPFLQSEDEDAEEKGEHFFIFTLNFDSRRFKIQMIICIILQSIIYTPVISCDLAANIIR